MSKLLLSGAAALACLMLVGPALAQIGPPEPPIEGPGCPRAGTTSPRTSERATLTISNPNRRDLTLYWVDFDGSAVPYANLRGRREHVLNTFVGHVFVVLAGSRCETVIRVPRGAPVYAF